MRYKSIRRNNAQSRKKAFKLKNILQLLNLILFFTLVFCLTCTHARSTNVYQRLQAKVTTLYNGSVHGVRKIFDYLVRVPSTSAYQTLHEQATALYNHSTYQVEVMSTSTYQGLQEKAATLYAESVHNVHDFFSHRLEILENATENAKNTTDLVIEKLTVIFQAVTDRTKEEVHTRVERMSHNLERAKSTIRNDLHKLSTTIKDYCVRLVLLADDLVLNALNDFKSFCSKKEFSQNNTREKKTD